MTQAPPLHTPESFARALVGLIEQVDGQERGADLDRVYKHVMGSPGEVSRLASLLFVLDEDYRRLLEDHVGAYRRWLAKKEQPAGDDDIFSVMIATYRTHRGIEG